VRRLKNHTNTQSAFETFL